MARLDPADRVSQSLMSTKNNGEVFYDNRGGFMVIFRSLYKQSICGVGYCGVGASTNLRKRRLELPVRIGTVATSA